MPPYGGDVARPGLSACYGSTTAWRNKKAPHLKGFLRGFLPDFIASFRNLCFDPPEEIKLIFNELEQLRNLVTAA